MTYRAWMAARELLAQEFIGALVEQLRAAEDQQAAKSLRAIK